MGRYARAKRRAPRRRSRWRNRALARSSLQSNIDRARIELILATLRRDTGARDKALSTLTGLLTTDVPLMLALAEAELNARRFSVAAEVFNNI